MNRISLRGKIRPIGPIRKRAVPTSLIGLLWRSAARTWRDFVWADLRDGTLSLRDLSSGTRSLIWLGFGLLVAALGLVTADDTIRAQLPLAALPSAVVGRGSLVPIALVPTTLFLIAIAWTFALTGALHAHPVIRLGTALLYVALAANWIGQATFARTLDVTLSWGAILLVPAFFVLRWRAAPRPILEFTPLLVLTSVTFVLLQAQGAESSRISGSALLLGQLNNEVLSLTVLILPLLALVGMSVAGFARQAADWTVEAGSHWLPGWALRAALALLLGWRLRTVTLEALSRVETSSSEAAALAYAGALGVPLAVGLAWLLVTRVPLIAKTPQGLSETPAASRLTPHPPVSGRGGAPELPSADGVAEAAEAHALGLIGAYFAPQLLGFGLVTLILPALTMGLVPYDIGPAYLATIADAVNATGVALSWRLLVAGTAVVAGLVLARRGHRELALFLAVFGLTAALKELTVPDRPLGLLAPYGSPASLVDFWWVLLFAGLAAVWLARGRLTDGRVASLLLLLLITVLLRQTDFISNRFSPFFGSGGVWFVAFGLAWDGLTIGAWANRSTPALPRVSRVLLYLGYSLLTVTIVNWAVAVHDLSALNRLTGEAALDGLQLFGRPMLYAIFAITLASPPQAAPSRNP
jgi:hypothetical protein